MASSAPMPSCLPPQLIIAWLPTRDVAAALRVSKDWCDKPEPIFKAIAGRHGLRRVDPSWRETVRRYRTRLGRMESHNPLAMRLHQAAQRDDAPAIQRLVSGDWDADRQMFPEPVDVNYAGGVGQTALHIAAMWGNLNAVNALIAAGADLNPQNWIERNYLGYIGGTPLHVAANSTKAPLAKRCRCAERLIEAGANARLLNGEEDAPYQSPLPEHESDLINMRGLAESRVRFRKLLTFAFRAQRCCDEDDVTEKSPDNLASAPKVSSPLGYVETSDVFDV